VEFLPQCTEKVKRSFVLFFLVKIAVDVVPAKDVDIHNHFSHSALTAPCSKQVALLEGRRRRGSGKQVVLSER